MEEANALKLIDLEWIEEKIKEKVKFMWKSPGFSHLGNIGSFSGQVPDPRAQLLSVTALATLGL
ncbi:hypothetical protein EM20IM_07765 [Candidatus Methylacidiphilum infernorum]|uniref:Uncharacterized protein n=1 Tax=Candidatus Methylacidiphilum infernorum TaxID=511746 RepID=A0ABX7PTT5_9BACT|nr:hypothetical protein [Candidatus Methylacidiphilum infernorum]QSR86389.1 hypothetical protein EM20IM_07765 [Candidatus Methylacidiphilum infernorum]